MLESITQMLQDVPWEGVLAIALVITFLENIFPPAPCDTVIVFTGSLISINVIGFFPLLIASTAGSIIGFAFMYFIGLRFGELIIDSNKLRFISRENLKKSDQWFKKFGYFIIIINRFLSGTRAVISFFAGISKMHFVKTILLSAISALLWNSILLWVGYFLGANWEIADYYLKVYGKIIAPIIVVSVIAFIVYKFLKRKKAKESKVTVVADEFNQGMSQKRHSERSEAE